MMRFVAVTAVILLFQNGVFSLTCPYKGITCAPYEVIENGVGYEKRLYARVSWAGYAMADDDLDSVRDPLVKKIRTYRNGANVKGEPVEMTTPLVFDIQPSHLSEYIFTLWIYITEDPVYKATDPDVMTENYFGITIFVREFRGNCTWADYKREKAALISSLNDAGKVYMQNTGYLAVYDDYQVPENERLNEVMLTESRN